MTNSNKPGEMRFYVDDVHTVTHDPWWSCSKTLDGLGVPARRATDIDRWPAFFDKPKAFAVQVTKVAIDRGGS